VCRAIPGNAEIQEATMRSTLATAVVGLFILFGAASLLAGCNTTAGAGKDISATGHAITNEANENKPAP
jgi:predicted small secreted protein